MSKGSDGFWKRVTGSLWKESDLPVLDGIRAISCIWVSSSHALFLWEMSAPEIWGKVYARWWPIAVPFSGDTGVDLFLLLSGYLIGIGVVKEIAQSGSFAWMRFFIRRVFRIVPVFWLAMAVAIVTMGPEACKGVWLRKLLFIENVSVNLPEEGLCVPQSWSVAVEMQLYFLTPPLIIAAFYIGKASGVPAARIVVVICACLWVACCGERLAAVPAVTAQKGSLWYTGTQYRCAPYLTGVATAALSEQGPLSGPPSGTAHKGAAAALQGMMTSLAWAVLLICMLYGGGGPLLGFESPLPKYPFGIRVAQLHFVIGRPLTGLAASYLMWRALAGRAQRLQTALALPMWRPFARLSYSAYMMQVASFVLGLSLLSPFNSPDGAAAQAVSALSELSTDLLLYVWVVLYILFAFTLALPSYILVEYPGIACGRRVARALACPIAEGRGELVKPLV